MTEKMKRRRRMKVRCSKKEADRICTGICS